MKILGIIIIIFAVYLFYIAKEIERGGYYSNIWGDALKEMLSDIMPFIALAIIISLIVLGLYFIL